MDIHVIVGNAYANGWAEVRDVFLRLVDQDFCAQAGQSQFVDEYFTELFLLAGRTAAEPDFWDMVKVWHGHRKLSLAGFVPGVNGQERTIVLLRLLRRLIHERLWQRQPFSGLQQDSNSQRFIIGIWCELFLSSFSLLNQYPEDKLVAIQAVQQLNSDFTVGSAAYYLKLLELSMYFPYAAGDCALQVRKLLNAPLPTFCKVILTLWLLNMPRYNAVKAHRSSLFHYFKQVLEVSQARPNWLDPFFHVFAEYVMIYFFRAAYIHDNNGQEQGMFGKFISLEMNRLFARQMAEISIRDKTSRTGKLRRRLRIGYVSSRFTTNAVTFYMGKRILEHDRNTFEVSMFVLGGRRDSMTERLACSCDHCSYIDNQLDFPQMIAAIGQRELDILIYADIGMDITTYLLAGLQLAPVQCALLGHASTTGLPTIQYFFTSNAIEGPQVSQQYSEIPVLLPGVACWQLEPPEWKGFDPAKWDRSRFAIPKDAVVFISCANGMKHIPERDYIYVEILRQVKNSWILLKPFGADDCDLPFLERMKRVEQEAGVAGRLIILRGCESQADLFGYLSMADIQLDSYPFNGWTTNIEAFCMGLPTVTQEGSGYRSRIGAAFLRTMGITQGIARSDAEYVEWAVRLAQDVELRSWVNKRIIMVGSRMMFENRLLQLEYEKSLLDIAPIFSEPN